MGLDVPRSVVTVFTVNLAIMWMVLVFMAAEKAGRDVNVQQVSENYVIAPFLKKKKTFTTLFHTDK